MQRLIIYSLGYCEYGSVHGNIYDLLFVMLLLQEYGTVLVYSVRVVDEEVNMSLVYLVIWVI